MDDPVIEPRLGQQPLNGPARALGNPAFPRGQAVEFLPKLDRVAQNAGHHLAQPVVFLGQHERNTAHFESLLVAGQNRVAGVLGGDLQGATRE